MLRKIIMSLGLLVAFLPYLGIPRSIDTTIYTVIGLGIFFLLVFSKKPKHIDPQELNIPPTSPSPERKENIGVTIPTISKMLEGESSVANDAGTPLAVKSESAERAATVHSVPSTFMSTDNAVASRGEEKPPKRAIRKKKSIVETTVPS